MTVFFYNENRRTFRKYYHKGIRDIKLREFIFTSHDSTKNCTLKYYLGRSLSKSWRNKIEYNHKRELFPVVEK